MWGLSRNNAKVDTLREKVADLEKHNVMLQAQMDDLTQKFKVLRGFVNKKYGLEDEQQNILEKKDESTNSDKRYDNMFSGEKFI